MQSSQITKIVWKKKNSRERWKPLFRAAHLREGRKLRHIPLLTCCKLRQNICHEIIMHSSFCAMIYIKTPQNLFSSFLHLTFTQKGKKRKIEQTKMSLRLQIIFFDFQFSSWISRFSVKIYVKFPMKHVECHCHVLS